MNGKRYVLVRYAGEQTLQTPPGAATVARARYQNKVSGAVRSHVALRFDRCRDARAYAEQYDCPRVSSLWRARQWVDAKTIHVMRRVFVSNDPSPESPVVP